MFYDLYIKLCEDKNISPTRAAIEMGISRATPTTWKKRGLNPQGETLNKIASYFGVTTDYLLGAGQEKPPAPEGEREISDDQIKAAFFNGADPTLTKDERDAMWDDARSYMQYKLAQRRQKKGNEH